MPKFEQTFADIVEDLERQARAVGLSQEALAVAGGISSSTLRRWKARAPVVVTVVTKMQAAVEAKRSA